MLDCELTNILYTDLLATDLAEFNLPGRLEHGLRRTGLSTYGDLEKYINAHGIDALRSISGVGKKSVDMIMRLREQYDQITASANSAVTGLANNAVTAPDEKASSKFTAPANSAVTAPVDSETTAPAEEL